MEAGAQPYSRKDDLSCRHDVVCGFSFSLADIDSGAATIVQGPSRALLSFQFFFDGNLLQGLDSDNANIDVDAVLQQIAGTISNFYDKEFERYASNISVQDCLRG